MVYLSIGQRLDRHMEDVEPLNSEVPGLLLITGPFTAPEAGLVSA